MTRDYSHRMGLGRPGLVALPILIDHSGSLETRTVRL